MKNLTRSRSVFDFEFFKRGQLLFKWSELKRKFINGCNMKTTLLERADGKKTLSISTDVYDSIKDFILTVLAEKGEIPFIDLLAIASQNGSLRYEGNLNWCFLVVKRDLEARGIIYVTISGGRNRVQIISRSKKKRSVL
jgi:hypothetical protein